MAAPSLSATREWYIALGSNQGDRVLQLVRALAGLRALAVDGVVRHSSFYETPPWGGVDQEPFLNAAAAARFDLAPDDLMDGLLALERRLGRPERHPRWGPRLIDLDLIATSDGLVWGSTRLTLPHPHAGARDFVLVPLREIAPAAADTLALPGYGHAPFSVFTEHKTVTDSLARVSALDTPPSVDR